MGSAFYWGSFPDDTSRVRHSLLRNGRVLELAYFDFGIGFSAFKNHSKQIFSSKVCNINALETLPTVGKVFGAV